MFFQPHFLPPEPVHSSFANPEWPQIYHPEATRDSRNHLVIDFIPSLNHDRPRQGRDLAEVIEGVTGRVRIRGQGSDLPSLH